MEQRRHNTGFVHYLAPIYAVTKIYIRNLDFSSVQFELVFITVDLGTKFQCHRKNN